VGHKDRKQFVFGSLYCLLFQIFNRKSMFAVQHSDINSLKSALLHSTGQLKSRGAKVKDGIRNLRLCNYLFDRLRLLPFQCLHSLKFAVPMVKNRPNWSPCLVCKKKIGKSGGGHANKRFAKQKTK
jgi:hypothetical protein